MFLAFLAVHVLGGIAAVASGAVAAIARKGSLRHIRAGRWYYQAITVVFITATVLAAMRWRQDYYLFILGAAAFTAATIGYQHRRRRRPGDTGHIAGMGVAYVVMLTAFYVDNGPRLPLWDHLPAPAFWLLPSAIGAPIIARAIIRASRARPSAKPSPRPAEPCYGNASSVACLNSFDSLDWLSPVTDGTNYDPTVARSVRVGPDQDARPV